MKEIEQIFRKIISDLRQLPIKGILELGISPQRIKSLKCPNEFPKLTYDEAIERLQKIGVKIGWGDDINKNHEVLLLKSEEEKPIFITHYPNPIWDHGKKIEVEKFFNMRPDTENPGRVLSCDLILPFGGEAIGAATRIYQADVLVQRLKGSRMFKRLMIKGGSLRDFQWYINRIREAGSIPHSGCGFGLARIVQWLKGCSDIRQCTTFPSNRATLI